MRAPTVAEELSSRETYVSVLSSRSRASFVSSTTSCRGRASVNCATCGSSRRVNTACKMTAALVVLCGFFLGYASSAQREPGKVTAGNGGLAAFSTAPPVLRNAIRTLTTAETRIGPYFDLAASRNVTALLGKTAYLNCRVKNLGNKTMMLQQVSWVRHRDIHLLTVGRYTYTSDQRFRAIHLPQTEDWTLQIKYPQHRDSGIYECQISTTPHMSHFIHLNVVEPTTDIIGGPDLYIDRGSTINLTCVVLYSPEPPAYIFWNHNDAIISYDSPRGGVSVVTEKGETTTSFLLIQKARPSDSGVYQCNPSNAQAKSIVVHVLNANSIFPLSGEYPAAMQRAAHTRGAVLAHAVLLAACLLFAAS